MEGTLRPQDLSAITDKEFNNELFHVYDYLIPIVEDIELKCAEINQLTKKVAKNKSAFFGGVLIPIWIVLSIFCLCSGILTHFPIIGTILQLIDENNGPYVMSFTFICFFFPYLLITLIRMAICRPIAQKQEKDIEEIKNYVDEKCKENTKYIQFVPPSYRNSHALRYFVKAYVNGKVENTKEAMISYDEYIHRMNMENAQKQIVMQQAAILNNQKYIQQQMDVTQAMMILGSIR